jgi:hypothetical protein
MIHAFAKNIDDAPFSDFALEPGEGFQPSWARRVHDDLLGQFGLRVVEELDELHEVQSEGSREVLGTPLWECQLQLAPL